ncbi:uncharacterized protein LOC128672978 [Plodia interpunctella]|uniref:uncharacterized protein LOC128672978 n=1 Tax=Plodia interpunctella TaxID=58824 RepID=UPI002367DF63|nr:uncharacterized protein LOC128672978 [Plodia interpunctella]
MQVEDKNGFSIKYEKNLEIKKDEDYPLKLKKSVKEIIQKEGFTDNKITVRSIPSDGGNCLAKLFEININGKTKEGNKNMDIFVKQILSDQMLTMFSITDAYIKEVFAYSELLKIYDKLQIEAKIPYEERFKFVKCYEETDREFIILEDISKKGFTTPDRLKPISLDFAKLSIEQIAKFHALSFVLEKKHPDYFNRKVKCQKHCFTFDEEWNKFIDNFCRISMKSLDHEMKKKVENIIPKILEKYPDYHLNTNTLCCLCHGDFRSNNVMMKMNDDLVEEVMLLDFQIIEYSCPLNDLFYFIFSTTDQQFRKDHLEDLKNLYHDTLGDFLMYFDMDVNDYFPRKTFDRLYKERLDFGLLTAVWFLPIVLADHDDAPDFSSQSAAEMNFKTDGSMKGRLEGILHDFIQWGYL